MTNAVNDAIARAQAAAANVLPATAATPAAGVPAQRPSLSDFANNAAVDTWLKVKEGGLQIGNDPKFHERLTFLVDFSAIDVFFQATGGNPPVYEKSRDRVMSESGKPWSEALRALSQLAGRNVRDFLSATIPMEVESDIQGKQGVTEAGTLVGYTLTYTGSQEFSKLQKKMVAAGWPTDSGVYRVSIEALASRNAAGNNYAKIQFVDIEPVDLGDE